MTPPVCRRGISGSRIEGRGRCKYGIRGKGGGKKRSSNTRRKLGADERLIPPGKSQGRTYFGYSSKHATEAGGESLSEKYK